MALWQDVDVDFGGEETINFGSRQETGSALYQIMTMATIGPVGEVACFDFSVSDLHTVNTLCTFLY